MQLIIVYVCFSEGVTQLSPVVMCALPPSLRRPAILSVRHCARLARGGWKVSLWRSLGAPDQPPRWQVQLEKKKKIGQ